MLDQDRLQEVLRYEPETGEFFWLKRSGKGVRSDLTGKPAGCLHHQGYINITINDQEYRAHRLAWFYVYGDWPEGQIDHIDRDKANNRIANLRVASQRQNSANSKARLSRSGLKGAYWQKRNQKWFSKLWRNGRKRSLGYFDSAESAHKAYCEAAQEIDGEFFHPG